MFRDLLVGMMVFGVGVSVTPTVGCATTTKKSVSSEKKESAPKPKGSIRSSKSIKKAAIDITPLKKVFNQFWTSDSVVMKLNKVVESELFSKTTKSFGVFYFSKGRLRVEIVKPQKTLLLVDDEYIWHVVQLPKELGDWQVSRTKKSLTSRSQSFLNLMFGDELYWMKLEPLELSADKNKNKIFVFKPKNKKDFPNLKELEMSINESKMQLVSIIQKDFVGNKTTFHFSDPDYTKLLPEKQFRIAVPEGVKVNEF